MAPTCARAPSACASTRDMILELVAHCPSRIHAACPQPGAQCALRRQQPDLLADGVGAQLLRPRRRPPARQPGRTSATSSSSRRCTTSCITTGGYPVEPIDIHPSIRHLECIRDLATLTDKAFHIYSLGKERNVDGIEIARIARGISPRAAAGRAVGLHHHQHQLAAAARRADDGGHHRDVVATARSSSSRRSRWPARWRR